MANDDPLTKFEAVLGAISKITSEDDTLVGARCPSCGASDFVAVSDLYAPANGTVTEINSELATAPEKINQDAHGAWMVKIRLKDTSELKALLSAADYESFIAEETGS